MKALNKANFRSTSRDTSKSTQNAKNFKVPKISKNEPYFASLLSHSIDLKPAPKLTNQKQAFGQQTSEDRIPPISSSQTPKNLKISESPKLASKSPITNSKSKIHNYDQNTRSFVLNLRMLPVRELDTSDFCIIGNQQYLSHSPLCRKHFENLKEDSVHSSYILKCKLLHPLIFYSHNQPLCQPCKNLQLHHLLISSVSRTFTYTHKIYKSKYVIY